MSAVGHEQKCSRDGVRPSLLLSGWNFCPSCQRMIQTTENQSSPQEAPDG